MQGLIRKNKKNAMVLINVTLSNDIYKPLPLSI